MATVPKSNAEKAAFFAARNAPWTTNATAIGVTTAAVSALAAKVTTAQAALAAQTSALAAAKAATVAVNEAIRAMDLDGTVLISTIRTRARTAGDGVYALAQLPPPAIPRPTPAPGTPTEFVATLNPNGSLGMTWKCANSGAGGVMYMIYRKVGATGAYISLGGTGERKYADATIPTGTSQVTYSIQAVRSSAAGQPAEFSVNFGANGLMSTNAVPVKLAA